MLENIINNYFTKALIRCFKTVALKRGIDLYIEKSKNEISIYAKDRKYTENLYKKIMVFDKSASIYYLCNLKDVKKEFDKVLQEYQRKECNHG